MTPTKSHTARQVRDTFERTWQEFYSTRPSRSHAVDDAQLLQSSETASELMLKRFDEFERRCEDSCSWATSSVLKRVNQHGKTKLRDVRSCPRNPIFTSSVVSSKAVFKSNLDTHFESHSLDVLVIPLPKYTFCILLRENWLKAEEKMITFHPNFGDNAEFQGDQYQLLFKNRFSWQQPGRDSDGEGQP